MKKFYLWTLTIAWALLIWRLTTTPQMILTNNSLLQSFLMIFAHFTFFGVQAMFLFFALRTNISALILSSAYGLIIELTQRTIPGRSADVLDCILDTLGAIVFLGIITKYENSRYGRSRIYRRDHS